jgi:hypothetical protein
MKKLLKEIHGALDHAINEWDTPDSPDEFCYAMKHLMNLRDRIAAILNL